MGQRGFSGTGLILHWDGHAWSKSLELTSPGYGPNYALFGVWGSGSTDVWAVGQNCPADSYGYAEWYQCTYSALHWNGAAWSSATLPKEIGSLNGVWGSGPCDVWAVGASTFDNVDASTVMQPRIVHWDCKAWSDASDSRVHGALRAVGGGGPGDVWAAGDDGIFHHS